MELTNEELDSAYICLYHEAYYGDDSVVYGNDEYAVNLRTALAKVEDEIKRRKL